MVTYAARLPRVKLAGTRRLAPRTVSGRSEPACALASYGAVAFALICYLACCAVARNA